MGVILYLERAYQYARDTDNTVSFRVGALDPSGRVRRVSGAQLQPILALNVVDAFDGHFVIDIADDSDLTAVVHGVLLEH